MPKYKSNDENRSLNGHFCSMTTTMTAMTTWSFGFSLGFGFSFSFGFGLRFGF